jgi:hypothetical protein
VGDCVDAHRHGGRAGGFWVGVCLQTHELQTNADPILESPEVVWPTAKRTREENAQSMPEKLHYEKDVSIEAEEVDACTHPRPRLAESRERL